VRARGISVGVVGGGIGGLSAALSLLAAGFDVHVYERAEALGNVGAGIQISPNASRILHRLGLRPTLASASVKPVAMHQHRWNDDRTLLCTQLGEPLEATFGFPHYHMHRADLIAALAGAIPADRMVPGLRTGRPSCRQGRGSWRSALPRTRPTAPGGRCSRP
jgi:salicylate hydroxylase